MKEPLGQPSGFKLFLGNPVFAEPVVSNAISAVDKQTGMDTCTTKLA